MDKTAHCPCGSGRPYDSCCGPLLAGTIAATTPEALMRSRYTAYVKQDLPYLARTLHPSQRNDYDEQGAARWAREADWEALDIVNTAVDPANTNKGTVEFKARYRMHGISHIHHELAEFRKSGDTWYFHDGKMVGAGQFRRDTPKVGRNDPCPCGSGKKYKKCCG
jgi:SEC-C motif-containing protein